MNFKEFFHSIILGSFTNDSKFNLLVSEEGIKETFKITFEKLLIKKAANVEKILVIMNFFRKGMIKKNVPINSPNKPFLEFVKKMPKITNIVRIIAIIFLFFESLLLNIDAKKNGNTPASAHPA